MGNVFTRLVRSSLTNMVDTGGFLFDDTLCHEVIRFGGLVHDACEASSSKASSNSTTTSYLKSTKIY